ncbi:hypothetical protein ACWDLL_06280 [Streptomyces griseoincarnatus]|uniref:hypothetical protein n=1 Tax=unclassified Streptomyces TaxID=2593676 RepID=UPI000C881D42|nr:MULTISPECIES: hypothetical protein [unclassified Streptomyces]MBJ6646338.1 hypothetical protein [Streptomyces sp. BSE7-9]MCA2203175.1 hypothetical protein [Streptomyces sp. SMS_SU21]NEA91421.1 hypothetical protein [Actinospica acidiphila]PWE07298.1 hypothetical protein DD630_09970 [Streptomyces sp. BSE7F]
MSTGLIIALIVIVAVVVAVAAVLTLRARGPRHGASLKRRFGPEYERAVARHDGDAKAAERELSERVERHGSLEVRPLEPAERERYEARWTAAQERFVDAPREAVAEADRLIAELAGTRGFPAGGQYEEQVAALSVHHAHHVEGYRRVHRVAQARPDGAHEGAAGTEDMREAMVEARALFEELVRPSRHDGGRRGAAGERTAAPATRRDGHRTPSLLHRRQAKES